MNRFPRSKLMRMEMRRYETLRKESPIFDVICHLSKQITSEAISSCARLQVKYNHTQQIIYVPEGQIWSCKLSIQTYLSYSLNFWGYNLKVKRDRILIMLLLSAGLQLFVLFTEKIQFSKLDK